MSVQRHRPAAPDAGDERRVDVTGLPAGDLRDFVARIDADVHLERKRATFVVVE